MPLPSFPNQSGQWLPDFYLHFLAWIFVLALKQIFALSYFYWYYLPAFFLPDLNFLRQIHNQHLLYNQICSAFLWVKHICSREKVSHLTLCLTYYFGKAIFSSGCCIPCPALLSNILKDILNNISGNMLLYHPE